MSRSRTEALRIAGLAVARRAASEPTESARSIVFVHGAMDRAASFGRVMRRLPDHDCLALDRRGYGGSVDAGIAPTLSRHVDDLVTVIDEATAGDVRVVGHSLGGRLALELATRGHPRVLDVVAFEPPAPDLDGSRERIGAGAIERGLDEGPAAAAEHFYRLMVGEQTWSRLSERNRAARRAEGPALLAELVDLRDGPSTWQPGDVRVPVVLAVGTLSAASLVAGAHALHERITGSTLVQVGGAGHGAHLTHPDEFSRLARGGGPTG